MGKIAAEIGRIVGVQRNRDAAAQQARDVVLLKRCEDAETDVREGTNSKGNMFGGESVQQCRILVRANAVIDPFDGEEVDCLSDVIRGTFLSRMGDGVPAMGARELEMPLEKSRLISSFSAVQADGQDVVATGT